MFTRRLGSVVGTAILCVGLAAQGALSQESPSAEGVVTEPGQYIKFTRVKDRSPTSSMSMSHWRVSRGGER